MCGRYSFTSPPEAVRQVFAFSGPLPNFPPRYNVAPTQDAAVVRLAPGDDGQTGARELALLRWGLVPSWSKGPDHRYTMINARAETVASKPAYRAAFKARRCLVPSDGFYEWKKIGGRKQPYRFQVADADVFAFAGLWEFWQRGEDTIESFTIIVTEANDLVCPVHDRMPVILAPEDHESWLHAKTAAAAHALLKPFPAERMTSYAVSGHVNNARHDDPECIAPAST